MDWISSPSPKIGEGGGEADGRGFSLIFVFSWKVFNPFSHAFA